MSKETPTPTKDAVDGKVELELAKDSILTNNGKSREELMDSIVKNRNAEVDSEMALDEEVKAKEPEKIAVKINGKESMVTPEEIREYQKAKAADEQFREVAKSRKELEDREKRIAAREAEIARQKATPPPANDPDLDETATELINSVFAEDKDAVKKVLAKLRPAAPTHITQTVRMTDEELETAFERRSRREALREAVKRFDTDYSDLSEFRDNVDRRTIVEQQADPSAAPWDIIDRAAKHVRSSIASIQTTAKGEKKVGTTPIRSTVTRRYVAPTPKESGKTPFEEIAAARGQ